jgi:hypothetical protein
MKPVVTEKQLKSLKLFSYYLQSHGMKQATLEVLYENCNISWFDTIYSSDGSRTETYSAIENVFEEIVENNNFENYMESCDNLARIVFNIDCVERTLEASIYEDIVSVRDMYDEIKVDEINDETYVKEIKKTFESMEENDIPEIAVDFSGGGDSGYINSDIDSEVLLTRGVIDYLYGWLSNFYSGWEIDEGSQGRFVFNLEEKTIYLEFGENVGESVENDIDFEIKF